MKKPEYANTQLPSGLDRWVQESRHASGRQGTPNIEGKSVKADAKAKSSPQKPGQSHGLPVALMGRVIEDLVEAYALITSRGRLTSTRPSSDVDHKDFIFDERGGYRNLYLQVKGVTQTNVIGEVRMHVTYRTGKILSAPRFLYLFCLLDVKLMCITRMWLIPSRDFNRLAPRPKARPGRVDLAFVAALKGKWERFLVQPEELGIRLLEVIETTPAAPQLPRALAPSLVMSIRSPDHVRPRFKLPG